MFLCAFVSPWFKKIIMQKQLQIWQFIHKSLQADIPVMLLYVLESNGSSPGRQGFFMAVNKDGEMHGSIGGGIMEHKFVEMAKDKLKHNMDSTSVKKQVHDKSAANNQSGMICSGGEMTAATPNGIYSSANSSGG